MLIGLNAPSGAGCLPTQENRRLQPRSVGLNAPSGAGCLPTECGLAGLKENTVSMHLLVPGAYRQYQVIVGALSIDSLNAPSGAGCLPTRKSPPMRFSLRVSMHLLVPGAYRHETSRSKSFGPRVSMHLLVPGAYRLDKPSLRWSDRSGSQCTFWCRVLTDPRGSDAGAWDRFLSQCTFWCRVLTDAAKEDRRPPPHSASQCTFWCRVLTDRVPAAATTHLAVSMHLLVPGAYRQTKK